MMRAKARYRDILHRDVMHPVGVAAEEASVLRVRDNVFKPQVVRPSDDVTGRTGLGRHYRPLAVAPPPRCLVAASDRVAPQVAEIRLDDAEKKEDAK